MALDLPLRQYAGLVSPGYLEFELGPILNPDGSVAIDFTDYVGQIVVRAQVVNPDGTLGPLWATDAVPDPTLTFSTIEADRLVMYHAFPAAPTVELPYVGPPAWIKDPFYASDYSIRFPLVTVAGARVFYPAICTELFNLDAC